MYNFEWYFERKIAESGVPIIYDFDDAIWETNKAGGNRALSFLKNPSKTAELIKISNTVIAGNDYLADYEMIRNVVIIREPWTIENHLLTPTLKIKRNLIHRKYRDYLLQWYDRKGGVIWE